MGFLDIRYTWIALLLGGVLLLRPKREVWYPFWGAGLALHLWPVAGVLSFVPTDLVGRLESAFLATLFGTIGVLLMKRRIVVNDGEELAKVKRRVLYKIPLLAGVIGYTLKNNLGQGSVFIFCGAIALASAFSLIRKHNIFWHYLGFILFMAASFGFYYASFPYRHMIVNISWVLGYMTIMNVVKVLELENEE